MVNTAESSKATTRVVELDALRALAAINLMLFHFTHVYTVKYGYTAPLGWEWPYGKYGVQLFFMLSGYVNAMTLFRKQEPGEFVVSRLIRIVPLFLLAVAMNLWILQLSPHPGVVSFSWQQVWANLTIMPNLFGFACLEPVTWTLQVEILFYGVLVGLFWMSRRVGLWWPLLGYLLFSAVAGYALQSSDEAETGTNRLAAWLGQLLIVKHFPLFAMGIALYELRSRRSSWRIVLPMIALAATIFHVNDDHDHNPVVTVLLLAILSLAAYGRLPWLGIGPLLTVSGISYSLYLLHNNLGCVLIHHLNSWGLPSNLAFGVTCVLSIASAWLVTHYFERPVSQYLRDRWRGRRRQPTLNPSVPPSDSMSVTSR